MENKFKEWLEIPDFPDYLLSKKGEIYSRCKNKLITPQSNGAYLKVVLYNKGKNQRFYLHRLVAKVFVPNPENKTQVNHINGNKLDNRCENLEWVTISENRIHSYRVLGCKPNNPSKGKFGKESHSSKIVQQLKNGKIIHEYYGIAEASRKTGIHENAIRNNVYNRSTNAGGYQWQHRKEA